MSEDIVYRELQQHLDNMPIGFPATKSGVEIRILKRLFTPEEAKLATKLQFAAKPSEPLASIFKRVGDLGISSIEELEAKLDIMVKKGLIHSKKEGDKKLYNNMIFAVGIYEYQVDTLTKDFIEDFMRFALEGYGFELFKVKTPQLRTIPIEQSITPKNYVGTYDDIKKIIEDIDGPIAVLSCICRQSSRIMGQPCKVTSREDTCFAFRDVAQDVIDRGKGRLVSKEEALEIIRQNQADGLVLEPGNVLNPEYLCSCCGCCCGLMMGRKMLSKPVEYFSTNYYAEVDPELCSGCETCIDRCQMDALKIIEGISTVNLDRCIGCGLCVPTCPSEAIQLKSKDKEMIPPQTMHELYSTIMDEKTAVIKAEEEKRERRRKRREAREKKLTN